MFCACTYGSEPVDVVLTYQLVDEREPSAGWPRALVAAINKRLGTTARARLVGDDKIAVDVYGQPNDEELEAIKRRVTELGHLEFRILADSEHAGDQPVIKSAKLLPHEQKYLVRGSIKVAEWVAYPLEEFGPVEENGRFVKRLAGDRAEALVLLDDLNVSGKYIQSAIKQLDAQGGPAVLLTFNAEGGKRFYKLTSQNLPRPEKPDQYRHLGIIFNKRLLSAPRILSALSNRVMISGNMMTERDVNSFVEMLELASLGPPVVKLVDVRRVAK
jgi:preprotein translocase subunit SecD